MGEIFYVNAWFFDWNGDGIEDAFVNASNTFSSYEDNTPNPPYYDKTVTYTISVLFLSGNAPLKISGSISDHTTKEPVNRVKDILASYNESTENSIGHTISAIQYDSEGNLMVCPIFHESEFEREREDDIILCDIDGDGKSELIVTDVGEYSCIIVLKLINSNPVEVFKATKGA